MPRQKGFGGRREKAECEAIRAERTLRLRNETLISVRTAAAMAAIASLRLRRALVREMHILMDGSSKAHLG